MNSALAKLQLIKGTPPCQPGKCAICGNCGDENSEFLDFGLELDFYGVVYFCTTCLMGDVLSALDLVTRERLVEFQTKLEEQTLKNKFLDNINRELRSIIESLNTHGFGVNSSRSSINSEQSSVDEKSEATSKSVETVSRKPTTAKQKSTRQTNVPGHTNVRNYDGITEPDI